MVSIDESNSNCCFADVLDIILRDVKEFDPQMWMYAVTISISALVVLSLTVCILLFRDHYLDMQEKRRKGKFHIFLLLETLLLTLIFDYFFLNRGRRMGVDWNNTKYYLESGLL